MDTWVDKLDGCLHVVSVETLVGIIKRRLHVYSLTRVVGGCGLSMGTKVILSANVRIACSCMQYNQTLGFETTS